LGAFHLAAAGLLFLDGIDHEQPLIKQARADYDRSVDALMSFGRDYGKARRDTATCAEKMMKGVLELSQIEFRKTHNLVSLGAKLNEVNGYSIDLKLLERIHVDPSVSYDLEVSKQEAYQAHWNLLAFLASLSTDVFGITLSMKR